MPRHLLLALVSLCLVFRALAAAHEPSYTITLFNVPDATYTTAFAINARDQMIGNYKDASFRTRGFLFDRGTFTPIDPPGAISTFPTASTSGGMSSGTIRMQTSRRRVFFSITAPSRPSFRQAPSPRHPRR